MRLILLASLALGMMATSAAAQEPALAFPLACQVGRDCEVQHYVDRDPGQGIKDYRCGRRTNDGHNGVDIRLLDFAAMRAGASVLATAPGRISRLRDGEPDISVHASGAPKTPNRDCGNGVVIDHGGGWETQSCHLKRGSISVKVGQMVQRGEPIGQVGLSGNTEYPHLHLTVRHAGEVVDPFAPNPEPGVCAVQSPLWTPEALRQMAYKAGAVLNTGFAAEQLDMSKIEGGRVARPVALSPNLIAYVRAIDLEAGDRVELTLTFPGGEVVAPAPLVLARDQAQHMIITGKRRRAEAWPRGPYRAVYRVVRDGKAVIERRFDMTL